MADQMTIPINARLHLLLQRFSEQFNTAFINLRSCIFYFFQGEQQIPAALFPHAAFINLRSRIFYFFQGEQRIPAAIFPHAAFAFTITAILGFLQVKYQGREKSPFESHPITISADVVSLLIYCFAYGIEQRLSSRAYRMPSWASDAIRWCMLLTGSLSVAATASFLFPDSVRPLLFAFHFIAIAGERVHWVYERFLREPIEESNWGLRPAQHFFMNIWRPLAHYFTQQRQLLPL